MYVLHLHSCIHTKMCSQMAVAAAGIEMPRRHSRRGRMAGSLEGHFDLYAWACSLSLSLCLGSSVWQDVARAFLVCASKEDPICKACPCRVWIYIYRERDREPRQGIKRKDKERDKERDREREIAIHNEYILIGASRNTNRCSMFRLQLHRAAGVCFGSGKGARSQEGLSEVGSAASLHVCAVLWTEIRQSLVTCTSTH